MFTGLDIQLDFGMYEDEKETKRKAKQLKKKGGKPLGGKLFKMSQQQPKPEPVKPKQTQAKDEDVPVEKINVKYQATEENNDEAPQKETGGQPQQPKVPRVRRIVGAQMIGGQSQTLEMPILNSSNPDDLQAQLALFLQQQKAAAAEKKKNDSEESTSMPKISGRNIAKNNNNNLPNINKRINKAEPNPIDEDIFMNAKQTLKNA